MGVGGQFRQALIAAPTEERAVLLTDYLRRKVAVVLKVEPATVELDRPLSEVGLDSLTSFELKNTIEAELGISVPVGKFIQRPTIAMIVPIVIEAIESGKNRNAESEGNSSFAPMSARQESLWFLSQQDDTDPNILRLAIQVEGSVTRECAEAVVKRLSERHDVLQMIFENDDVGPISREGREWPATLAWHDLGQASAVEVARVLEVEGQANFDLKRGALCRFSWLQGDGCAHLLVQAHAIVCDRESLAMLAREFLAECLAQAQQSMVDHNEASFQAFVEHERQQLKENGVLLRDYWCEALKDYKADLFPSDDEPGRASRLGRRIEGDLLARLKSIAASDNMDLSDLLFAVWGMLVAQLASSNDVVVGRIVSLRNLPQFKRVVGPLANLVPVRVAIKPDVGFDASLREIAARWHRDLEHSHYPFSRIVADSACRRRPHGISLAEAAFISTSAERDGVKIAQLHAEGAWSQTDFASSHAVVFPGPRIALTLTAEEHAGVLYVLAETSAYARGCNAPMLLRRYEALLQMVASEPSRPLVAVSNVAGGHAAPLSGRSRDVQTAAPVPVSTSATRSMLARILADLLSQETVDEEADFFAMGGDSLLAFRYLTQVRKVLGVAISMAAFVVIPTVARLEHLIDRERGSASYIREWKPLPMRRAEMPFRVDAAIVMPLPDASLRLSAQFGLETELQREMKGLSSAWSALCETPLGKVAVIGAPHFSSRLAHPDLAAKVGGEVAQLAKQLGSLALCVPEALRLAPERESLTITTPAFAAAAAALLLAEKLLQALGGQIVDEAVRVVGDGECAAAVAHLLGAQGSNPAGQGRDTRRARRQLWILADDPGLAAGDLEPGAIVIDAREESVGVLDSLSDRMQKRGDVLVTSAAHLSCPSPVSWQLPSFERVDDKLTGWDINQLLPRKNELPVGVAAALVASLRPAAVQSGDPVLYMNELRELGFGACAACMGDAPIDESFMKRFARSRRQPVRETLEGATPDESL